MTSFVREIHHRAKVPMTAAKKKEAQDLLTAKYNTDSRLVKGVFKNLEAPGGTETFPYKEFPQDPIRMYALEDGKSYEIPLCLAIHINKDCNEKKHKYVVDKEGNNTMDLNRSRQRFQFLSTEFMGE